MNIPSKCLNLLKSSGSHKSARPERVTMNGKQKSTISWTRRISKRKTLLSTFGELINLITGIIRQTTISKKHFELT